MPWVTVTILAAFLIALSQIMDKYVVSWRTNVASTVMLFLGPANLFYAAILLFVFKADVVLTVVSIVAIISGSLTAIASLMRYNALSKEETSRVSPLMFTSPLLVAILAWIFLNEVFPSFIYAGVILVVAGAFLLSFRLKDGVPEKIPVLGLVLMIIVLLSITSILIKWAQLTIDYVSFLFYNTLGFAIIMLPLWFHQNFRREFISSFIKKRIGFGSLLLMEAFGASGGFLLYYAYSLGSATLVATLFSVSPFFLLLLVALISLINPKILKEEMTKWIILIKLAAIVLIVLGVYLII